MVLLESGKMVRWYWLNPDHTIRPGPDSTETEAFTAYSMWLYGNDANGRPNKMVEFTDCQDGGYVSTVFLGLDHSFHIGDPVVFESMYFVGNHGTDQQRYKTWEEALAGHHLLVARHKGPLR